MKPLKPVMAALLAAASATFALPGISFATPTTPPKSAPVKKAPACPTDGSEKNPVNALACIIAQTPAARADIGARLSRFVVGKDANGGQYVTADLLADTTLLPAVQQIAKDWPEKNKSKPGDIAALYFVIGPDDAALPAWAQTPLLTKTLGPNMSWSGRLGTALAGKGWTDKSKNQIAQSGAAEATAAFLNDAVAQAWIVLSDTRTKSDIQISIGANDTTGVQVPTVTSGPSPLDSTGSGFGFDDLYKTGAEVANVYGPKDDGYRTLSMKIYTSLDDSGNPVNRIGIVDITAGDITSPTVPQFIDASHPGDTDVAMREGGRSYTVTVGADGSVTLRRAGAKDGDGGGSLSTTKSQLSADRDAQIMTRGTVMIGGQPYYVLGQGGGKGSFLFFSQALMQASPTGNDHPALMGEVAQVIGDGTTAPIKGQPPLGTLQDGTKWHLEFNMTTRLWEVKPGVGTGVDDGKKNHTGAGSADGSTNTATSPAAGPVSSTDTTTTDPATLPTDPGPGAATTLEQAIAYAKTPKSDKTQVWAEDASNKKLDAATLAQVRIMVNTQPDTFKHFKVLFDPSFGVNDPRLTYKNNSFEFLPLSQDVRLLHVRGVKSFIALDYATNTQYYDLPNFVNYVKHVYDASLSYAQAGSYSTSNGQMQTVTSVDIMEDILTHPMKVKAADPMIQTLKDRVAKNAKDSGYVINGDTTTLYLGWGENGMTIWPKEIKAGDTGTNAGMTGLHGPGTAVAVTGGDSAGFPDSMDLGSGRTATRVNTENNAAMYSNDEDENVKGTITTQKVWSIMIEYTKNKLPSRSKALPVFGGQDRFSLPTGYHMQGLLGLDLPDSTQLMLLYGSTQENGGIAAYRYVLPDAQGGSNARDKKGNCAGPVLWWGTVTKAQVQKACDGSSKIN